MYEKKLPRRAFLGDIDILGKIHQRKVIEIMNERQKQLKNMVMASKPKLNERFGKAVSRRSSIKSIAQRGGMRQSVVLSLGTNKFKTGNFLKK